MSLELPQGEERALRSTLEGLPHRQSRGGNLLRLADGRVGLAMAGEIEGRAGGWVVIEM